MAKAGIFRDTRTEAAPWLPRGSLPASPPPCGGASRGPRSPPSPSPSPSPSLPRSLRATARTNASSTVEKTQRQARPLAQPNRPVPARGPTRTCAPGRGLRSRLRGARAPGSPGLKRRGHATSGTNGLPAPGLLLRPRPAPARPGPSDHREARPPRSLEGPARASARRAHAGRRGTAPRLSPEERSADARGSCSPGREASPRPTAGARARGGLRLPSTGTVVAGPRAPGKEARTAARAAAPSAAGPAPGQAPRPPPAPSSPSGKAGWEPAGPGRRAGIAVVGAGDLQIKYTRTCSPRCSASDVAKEFIRGASIAKDLTDFIKRFTNQVTSHLANRRSCEEWYYLEEGSLCAECQGLGEPGGLGTPIRGGAGTSRWLWEHQGGLLGPFSLLLLLLLLMHNPFNACLFTGSLYLLLCLFSFEPGSSRRALQVLKPGGYVSTIAHKAPPPPENTLAGFWQAAKNGATGVQLDLEFTSDGIPNLMHDNTVDRTTDGTSRLCDLTFEQIRKLNPTATYNHRLRNDFPDEKIPTLRQALRVECLNYNLTIFGVKGHANMATDALKKIYLEFPQLYNNSIVCSFLPEVIYKMRQTDQNAVTALTQRPWSLSHTGDGKPRYDTFWKQSMFVVMDILLDWSMHNILWYLCGISVFLLQKDFISPDYLKKWSAKGIQVVGWTVNIFDEKSYYESHLGSSYITDSMLEDCASQF
ncbi:LOW QUALITY PROTEIN: uncharacterized protein LOC118351073 [Canis lupus dingo]|uniref:LOW QUALITY PROTEIN: uncharacterized protein LOC118351073 n=1 Tax=Canis lupus dingo TaxID=286419 RepID=UPI0020C37350|nr:LOW QUALITY PROTEIN: uncharacterized protein LOC118351073 [Canis lupus dingo]